MQTVKPARPWRAKASIFQFCLDMLDEACDGAVRFIQIGAHDGVLADPISGHLKRGQWRGLMIEPHPRYFADLKKHLEGMTGVELFNCAVSDREGELELFHVAEEHLDRFPAWARGCATLSRERLLETLAGSHSDGATANVESSIRSVAVPTRTVPDILDSAGQRTADLLLIDVEGWELRILKSFDCSALELKLAIIECNGPNRGDQMEISSIMTQAGFEVFRLRDDLVAIHPDRMLVPLPRVLELLEQDRLFHDAQFTSEGQINAHS